MVMTPDAAALPVHNSRAEIATFGGDAVIGALGGLIGLGGAEFRAYSIGFFRSCTSGGPAGRCRSRRADRADVSACSISGLMFVGCR